MTKKIPTPHDRIFKAALKNVQVAREYFEEYLPQEVLEHINLDKLEPCPEIYVNQHLALSESDVVYKTEISGEVGYICLAAEHQSTDDIFMPFRILKYNVAVWDFHKMQHPEAKKLPLIINVVFYNGKQRYRSSTDFKDLLDAPRELVEKFWAKPFILVETQEIPDEKLLRQKWAGLFQYFMKRIYEPDLLPWLEPALPLLKIVDENNGIEYIEAVSVYALSAGEISDTPKFVEIFENELSEITRRKVMTGAEQLMQIGEKRGLEQGMLQGMQQGALAGERTILKRQLERKFRFVPSEYLSQIDRADSDLLLLWGDRILDAETLEDIFRVYH